MLATSDARTEGGANGRLKGSNAGDEGCRADDEI